MLGKILKGWSWGAVLSVGVPQELILVKVFPFGGGGGGKDHILWVLWVDVTMAILYIFIFCATKSCTHNYDNFFCSYSN